MSGTPRVLMANWSTRRAGGAERYLEQSIAALCAHGIPVALWAEADLPADRPPIALGGAVPGWVGAPALADARRWGPTLVVVHGVRDPAAVAALRAIAPAAFVSHNYLGTCISGSKTHKSLTPRACTRTLGWACLAHYYPNHCGGWDPRTMVRLFRANREALAGMRAAPGAIALSAHMAGELSRHGIARERIELVPPSVDPIDATPAPAPRAGEPWRLLFVGRLDQLKGAAVLLDALPLASASLARPLSLTIMGDGPARDELEARAAVLARAHPGVSVEHAGWIADARATHATFARHHLLVMPSLWPEPFGLVGLEAGAAGVPTVAFDSGGIPDWLEDGVGGVLVRDHPRTSQALARGVARALRDAVTWRRLGDGARAAADAHAFPRFAARMAEAVRRLSAAGAP